MFSTIRGLVVWLLIINYSDLSHGTVVSPYHYDVKQFDVPVDHFSYLKSETFSLRYLYNASFAKKSDAPLFFYTGNEGDIELFAQNTGFLWELAEQFNAMVVFAEHRFYGKSFPSFCNATLNNISCIEYLTVEQTLEDFAAIINYLTIDKPRPVIAFGGSYGGMLSTWLRLKYPHFVTGALAASAPIWQFNELTPCDTFNRIITTVFTTSLTSNCSENIKNSWSLLKNLAGSAGGRKQINDVFKLCTPLNEPADVEKLMDYLEDMYGNLCMANYPYANNFLAPLPAYPVRQFCFYLNELFEGTNLLNAMQNAVSVYANYTGNVKCLNYDSAYDPNLGGIVWDAQTCNQMVFPMCSNASDSMFRQREWDFKAYSDNCFNKFKIRPKLDEITFRYGGKRLRDASNIIFSNGLLDPWCGGGVLQSINSDIAVIIIPEGAHHLDLRASNPDDPASVIEARKREQKIIAKWIIDF